MISFFEVKGHFSSISNSLYMIVREFRGSKLLLFLTADYVSWKGRYAAFDYAAYEHAMKYILAQVMGQNPPLPDPWDTHIDPNFAGEFLISEAEFHNY